jgi:hypothetical protein
MSKKFILLINILIIGLTPLLFSVVKQIRVTSERASIYAEPNRSSTRIDIVEKGTILNLFQQNKVKSVWYYVSYNSPRYGTRVSGFIHESFVELVGEEKPSQPQPEELKKPEKPEPAPVIAKPAPPPRIEEKKEVKPEAQPVPKIEVSLGLTALPKSQSYRFPRKEPSRQDVAWPIAAPVKVEKPEPAPAVEKPAPPPEKVLVEQPKEITTPPPAPKVRKVQPEPKKEKPEAQPEVKKAKPKIRPEPKKPEKEAPPPAQVAPVRPPPVAGPRKGRGLFAFGLGYGSSFGGAGGCIQVNTTAGIALHGGVGMYPTKAIYSETDWVKNELLYSVGIKYYLPFQSQSISPYVDLQYGGLSVEAVQIVSGIWESSYVYSHEQKTLWGPSFLAGTEIRMGRLGLNGALGISYNLTDWEFLKQRLFFAFDASLVIYF